MESSTFSISSLSEASVSKPFEMSSLELQSDSELDLLPFGVICLNEDGIVLKYNLAEARLARLDRSQVLGKSFFRVVAPCTATPEFEGRFRTFLKSQEPSIRFPYIFDFKFGAQEVEIELWRPKEKGKSFLCINRKRFLDPRKSLPPNFAAPLQKELAPNEEAQGVLRDTQSRRWVQFDNTILSSMRVTWDKLAPKGWEPFCEGWGLQWGRLLMIELETQSLEKNDKSLRELPTREVLSQLSGTLKKMGWGDVSFDFSAAGDGAFVVHLERNALAESIGRSESGRCQLMSGLFQGVFSSLSQRVVHCQEVSCYCQGHSRCSFIIVHAKRKSALQKVTQETQEISRILSLLREVPREAP